MKVTKLTIKNIGIIADTVIEFNKPLILVYGDIRQGKTTVLNCVRWVCGGPFPQDIIRHGQKEAVIEMGFEGGHVRREFYKTKDGKKTQSRDIQFVRAGRPVPKPVTEIERLLNPFLLNQDHLRNMTETERKKYFTELFAVDTTALDTELYESEKKASGLRSEIKGFGEIDTTKVDRVDIAAAEFELNGLRDAHNDETQKASVQSGLAQQHNAKVESTEQKVTELANELTDLEGKVKAVKDRIKSAQVWIEKNPKQATAPAPVAPPRIAQLETVIREGAAQNVRAEQYQKNLTRMRELDAKQKDLSAREKRQREIKEEKIAKLKGVSETCGIAGLVFDEEGSFTYQDTQAGMLSTSQVMKLSSELSALYPEGFGVELLDRAESLGRSIFEYIELAKRDNKTVLASIVGQRPAKTPEECSVYVVKDGQVIPDEEEEK